MLDLIVNLQVRLTERWRLLREEGATAVEYALMLGLMFLALLIGATNFSRTVNRSYNSITNSIASAVG